MAFPLAVVMAAIAGINALKQNDDKKRDHQQAINDAEQQLWDKRNAEIQALRDRMNGIDPSANAFANQLSSFRDQVGSMPVPQDWTPLVKAAGTAAGAIYDEGQKPDIAPKAPTTEDIPGQNFSASPNYTPAANYSEWQPVEHKRAEHGAGNYFSNAARRFEEEDERSLPEWLR